MILASCLMACSVLSSWCVGSMMELGSAAHLMTSISRAGLNPATMAAIFVSILRSIQLSSLTFMSGCRSIFLEPNIIKWSGDTIVIPLQATALVLNFSLNTKKGTGNSIASLEQFTLDLWISATLASVVNTFLFSLCLQTLG